MAEAKKTRSEASTSGSCSGGGDEGRLESVVVDVGRRKSSCGYCKSGARTRISHGLWPHSLTVDDYQALLDRGWRRSGCFLYKPEMEKTCCPPYTIRLKASEFVPSKEQGRVSRRMKRFLDGTLDVKGKDKFIDELHTSESIKNNQYTIASAMDTSVTDCKETDKSEEITRFLSEKIDDAVQLCVKSGKISSDAHLRKPSVKKVPPAKNKLKAENSEKLAFSSSIAFQVAATLKRSKKDVDLSPKTIAEILTSLIEPCGLTVRACNGHINFYSAIEQTDSVEVQRGVKPNTDRHLKNNSEGHQNKSRRFEIRLKNSSFDDEEYSLYRKYQLRVHNDAPDHVSESSYKRFLVDTPLVHVPTGGDHVGPPCGFGSFHQQYVVDGRLIAVGVVDILPKCLSSKYLFWDPDFAFLSLGKYSALEEIRWVGDSQLHCPSLQFYYLGYYIHTCSKMRYKAAYQPSELLCPLRFRWVPYDIAKPLLDRRKYVILSDYASLQNGEPLPLDVGVSQMDELQNEFALGSSNDAMVYEDEMELDSDCSDDESDLEASTEASLALEVVNHGNVLIEVRGARLRYKDLRCGFEPGQRKFIESHLQRYVKVVGTELSERMAYSLG